MTRIYTVGYTGWTPDQILREAERLDATVLDIRIRPYSRKAEWNRPSLEAMWGDRYRHVEGFGNMNYRNGGPILLKSFSQGVKVLREVLAQRPAVILMCVCHRFDQCHRKIIVERLERTDGEFLEHQELTKTPGATQTPFGWSRQKSLFDE